MREVEPVAVEATRGLVGLVQLYVLTVFNVFWTGPPPSACVAQPRFLFGHHVFVCLQARRLARPASRSTARGVLPQPAPQKKHSGAVFRRVGARPGHASLAAAGAACAAPEHALTVGEA